MRTLTHLAIAATVLGCAPDAAVAPGEVAPDNLQLYGKGDTLPVLLGAVGAVLLAVGVAAFALRKHEGGLLGSLKYVFCSIHEDKSLKETVSIRKTSRHLSIQESPW